MELTEQEKAYFAGFFDGEGSVIIYKRKTPVNYPKREGSRCGVGVTIPYRIHVTVTNTNYAIVKDFKAAFGAACPPYPTSHSLKRKNHRPAWKWFASCQKAAAFLRAVLPYLRVKRLEAEVALAMQDTIDRFKHRSHAKGRWGQEPLPVEEITYRDSLHRKIQDLRVPHHIN